MSKLKYALLLILFISSITSAQVITDYVFTASSGTYIPLIDATNPTLSGGTLDDGYYNAIPIGFTFNFNDNSYTSVSVTTNGVMFLGGPTLTSSWLTNNLATNTLRSMIAPLWDDNELAASTDMNYKTEGSEGSRVFTVQWSNVYWNYTATTASISFQVKLYEGTNQIRFVYRQEAGSTAGTLSASIGIGGVNSGPGNFLSLDGTGPSPNVSSTVETNTLNTRPATGQIYDFTPPPPTTNNVGVVSILSPGATHLVNSLMTPSARIKNYGTAMQSFVVRCSIINSTGTVRHINQQSVTSLLGGDTITKTFGSWTPTVNELLTVFVTTYLAGDEYPANDQKTRTCEVGPYVYIGTGTLSTTLYPINRATNFSVSEAVYLQSEIGYAGYITNLAYFKASGTDVTPIESVAIFMKHTSATTVATGVWDTTGYTLVFAGAFTNDATSGWMDVDLDNPFLYNNTSNLQVLIIKGRPAVTTGAPSYRYTSTSPNNQNRYGSGTTLPPSLTAIVNRPNIRFALSSSLPANDVGVQSILSPTGTINMRITSSVPVRAKIKNYGTANQPNFAVRCTIYRNGPIYTNARTISLNAGDTVTVQFDNWTVSPGVCTVATRTFLGSDENPVNDRKISVVTVNRPAYTGGPDLGNMRWIDSDTTGGPVYNWKDITGTGTNVVFPTFDDAIGRIPIGFNFTFYDKTRNRLTVGTNGALSLDSVAIPLTNTTMPNSATPNNLIAGLWDDLHVRRLGTVKYQTLGTSPNCTLVVSYDSIRYLGGGDSTLAFQFLLCEGSNDIIIQYKNVITGHTTRDAGLSATVGIEDSTGTIGLQYLKDGDPVGNLLSAPRAIKFYYQPYDNDVGVSSIISPTASHAANVLMTPQANVKNYGVLGQSNFAVVCSIFGQDGITVRHQNTQIISLAGGRDTTVSFTSWTPTIGETLNVKIATGLVGDENLANNIRTRKTFVSVVVDAGVTAIARPATTEQKRITFTPEVTVVNNGSFTADVPVIAEIWTTKLSESFTSLTFPPTGWQVHNRDGATGTPPNLYQWQRRTTREIPWDFDPYSLPACAGVRYHSTIRSDDWLVTPGISVSTGDILVFMEQGDDYWQDTLEVWVTTTGQTPDDFLNNGTRLDVFRMSLGVWGQKTYSLSAYAGQTIYIGFRYWCLNEFYAALDDITVLNQVYRDSVAVTVEPGVPAQATFAPHTIMTTGNYIFNSYTKLPGDMNTANNLMTRNFTVELIPLTLISPENGIRTNNNTPMFSWNAVPGVELYRIEVDNNDDFSSPEFAGTLGDVEIESDELLDGLYYWHVRAEAPGTPDPYSATRQFTIATQILAVTVVGGGTVEKNPDFPYYVYGSEVALTANPNPGYRFVGWSGDITGTEPNTSIIMNGHKSVTATFALLEEPGWAQKESIPRAYDVKPDKYVKDGGAMVAVGNDLYAFHGNKSRAFFKYNTTDGWQSLESIPYGVKPPPQTGVNKKKIGKGAALCWNGGNIIYATKGAGTKEFWAYYINEEEGIPADTWIAKEFVPVPKGLKGGTQMDYCDGEVFLLAGGQKATEDNYFIYNTTHNTWAPAPSRAPLFFGKPYKDGTVMTLLTLPATPTVKLNYCVVIRKCTLYYWYHYKKPAELYCRQKKGKIVLPPPFCTWKNTKDGAAIASAGDKAYLVTGGGSQEFWKITAQFVEEDTSVTFAMTALDTIPKLHKKSVPKTGAALAYANNGVYLLKGNNTPEFWKYVPAIPPYASIIPNTINAVMTERTNTAFTFAINVTPNPITRNTMISYSLPTAGKASLKLYNSSGRLVETLLDNTMSAGNYTMTLNANTLAKGVYFLKYEHNTNKAEVKLIVQ